MSHKVRVLVVDDSTFMRSALVRMILRSPHFEVIDTACNGKEGVEKAKALKPDVITMDVEMPVMTGLEALREIMSTVKIPVIMVSTLTEAGARTTLEALDIGAVDFIPKALNDKDNNIFRGAEVIHQKLLAAAHAGGGYKVSAAMREEMPTAKSVIAPSLDGAKVAKVQARMVVIGSSTGGPKALQAVIQKLPARLSVPVVIAQHMPAQFTTALAKRLDETCAITVKEAQDGDMPQPGYVYIAPGGMHMRMTPGGLKVSEDRGESPYKPSVDVLAESVAGVMKGNVLAVMLTGMGSDGTREFTRLKQLGAHVIAQDQATSVVYGMPKAVLEAGGVSEVLPLDGIGERIARLLF